MQLVRCVFRKLAPVKSALLSPLTARRLPFHPTRSRIFRAGLPGALKNSPLKQSFPVLENSCVGLCTGKVLWSVSIPHGAGCLHMEACDSEGRRDVARQHERHVLRATACCDEKTNSPNTYRLRSTSSTVFQGLKRT